MFKIELKLANYRYIEAGQKHSFQIKWFFHNAGF